MNRRKVWRLFAVLAIITSLSFSGYRWYRVIAWSNVVESNRGWYENPELARLELMFRYQKTFAEIILLNSLVFALIFLLPKAGKPSKENG